MYNLAKTYFSPSLSAAPFWTDKAGYHAAKDHCCDWQTDFMELPVKYNYICRNQQKEKRSNINSTDNSILAAYLLATI